MYQTCDCPVVAKRLFQKAFGLSMKAPAVQLPSFILIDQWNIWTNDFRDRLRGSFDRDRSTFMTPSGSCGQFSDDLEKWLAAAYSGKCVNGLLTIMMNNREMVLRKLVAQIPNGPSHCYLVLIAGDEEWIVDPTWKQFATKWENGCLRLSSPYHKRLHQDFPDILVIKRDGLSTLMGALSEEAGHQKIQENSQYWDQTFATECTPLKEAF